MPTIYESREDDLNIQSNSESASLIQQPLQQEQELLPTMYSSNRGNEDKSTSGLTLQFKLLIGLLGVISVLLIWIAVVLTVTVTTISSDKFAENVISSGIVGVKDALRFQSVSYYVQQLLSYPLLQIPSVVGAALQFNYGGAATNVDNLLTGNVVKNALASIQQQCKDQTCRDVVNDVSDTINALASVVEKAKQINPNQNGTRPTASGDSGDTTDVINDIVSYVNSQLDGSKWSSLAGPCITLYSQLNAAASPLVGQYSSTCDDNNECYCLIGFGDPTSCRRESAAPTTTRGKPCQCLWSYNEMSTTILPTMEKVCNVLHSLSNDASAGNTE